jgi:hypothetical protein
MRRARARIPCALATRGHRLLTRAARLGFEESVGVHPFAEAGHPVGYRALGACAHSESVPLKEDIQAYSKREVLPHVPDAWIDESKTKVGYEIPLNRHFYRYEPPRPLEAIEADIKQLEGEILDLLKDVTA